jgi:hypothetical protein
MIYLIWKILGHSTHVPFCINHFHITMTQFSNNNIFQTFTCHSFHSIVVDVFIIGLNGDLHVWIWHRRKKLKSDGFESFNFVYECNSLPNLKIHIRPHIEFSSIQDWTRAIGQRKERVRFDFTRKWPFLPLNDERL